MEFILDGLTVIFCLLFLFLLGWLLLSLRFLECLSLIDKIGKLLFLKPFNGGLGIFRHLLVNLVPGYHFSVFNILLSSILAGILCLGPEQVNGCLEGNPSRAVFILT